MTRLEALFRRSADRRRHAVAAARRATEQLSGLGVEVRVIGQLAAGRFKAHSDIALMAVGRRDGVDRTWFLGLGRHVDIVLVSPERFRRSTSPVVRAAPEEGIRLRP